MKKLCSSGLIDKNTNPHDIRDVIKIELKAIVNPETSKCKAIISNGKSQFPLGTVLISTFHTSL